MNSNEADNIDKLYKNYDILNDAKEKIAEVSGYAPIHPNVQHIQTDAVFYFIFQCEKKHVDSWMVISTMHFDS